MRKLLSVVILLVAAAFFMGCPKKPTIVKEEAKAPVVDTEKAAAEARAREEAEAKARAEADARARAQAEADARSRMQAEADAAKAEAASRVETKAGEEFRLEDIHFDFDKYDIKEKDRAILKGLGEWLSKSKSSRIQIEGHCDERGTNEYNLALGERRANSAKQYLVTLGIAKERISTITYGEEKPLCNESSEDCWAKNRRGHFVIQEK